MEKMALRLAQAEVLRVEAAIERRQAEIIRQNGELGLPNDTVLEELYISLHETKANLLETQADYLLHAPDEEFVP